MKEKEREKEKEGQRQRIAEFLEWVKIRYDERRK